MATRFFITTNHRSVKIMALVGATASVAALEAAAALPLAVESLLQSGWQLASHLV